MNHIHYNEASAHFLGETKLDLIEIISSLVSLGEFVKSMAIPYASSLADQRY